MFEPVQEAAGDGSAGDIINLRSGIYSCGPCSIHVKEERDFRRHLETHTFDCLYRCLYCSGLSPHTSDITEHIVEEHPGKEKYYGCLVFPTTDQIVSALRTRREEKIVDWTKAKAASDPKKGEITVSKSDAKPNSNTPKPQEKAEASSGSSSTSTVDVQDSTAKSVIASDVVVTETAKDDTFPEPGDEAVETVEIESQTATVETVITDQIVYPSNQCENEDADGSDLEITTDVHECTISDVAQDEQSDTSDGDADSKQKHMDLTTEEQDANTSEEPSPVQEHDLTIEINQAEVILKETNDTDQVSQEEVIEEEATSEKEVDCKQPEPNECTEKEWTKKTDAADVEKPGSDHGEASEDKLSLGDRSSSDEKNKVSKKEATAGTASGENSDLEVTGETLVLTPRHKQHTTLKTPGKDGNFKTNMQCVYHRGMYTCKTCLESSKNYVEFARHVFSHLHKPNGKGGHDCTFCPYPIEEDCIVRPLACALVTQMMGMLQKQKKAQDWSRQQSVPPGVPTSAKRMQPLGDSTACKPPVKANQFQVFSRMNYGSPRHFLSKKPASASQMSANGQEESYSAKYCPIEAEPIVIEPTSIEPEEPGNSNQGSDESGVLSGDTNITTEATGREESPQVSTSTDIFDDRLHIDIHSVQPATSGGCRSSFDEPPLSPIPPWTVEGNAATTKVKRHFKGFGSVVKCYHIGGKFRCARCDYSVHDSKPKVFRKHLWFEVHPFRTCDHCPDSVKYNRFMSCPVINELLTYLLEVKAKKDYDAAHNGKKLSEDIMDDMNSPKTATLSDADSASVVNEDNSSCGSYSKRPRQNSADSENGHCEKSRRSSTAASPTPTPTDVIAMIQGLNDPDVNACVNQDLDNAHSKADEMESESMFVITSVVSQASEAGVEGNKANGADVGQERGRVSSQRGQTLLNLAVDRLRVEEDSGLQDEEALKAQPAGPATGLDGRFQSSRQKPWTKASDKTTVPSKSSTKSVHSETKTTSANYTCGFYKCSFWTTADTESFRIHNANSHKMAERFCCAFCAQVFQSNTFLMQHQDNEHMHAQLYINFRSYHCGFKDCSWTSNKEEEFMHHNESAHPDAGSYPCCFCKATISSVRSLVEHINESVRYSCSLCPNVESTYVEIAKHVSSQHAPSEVDAYIQLQLTCVSNVSPDGEHAYKTINRCIYKQKALQPEAAMQEFQETFKCTNCGLLTCDEEYFERHVIECMKNPPLKSKPLTPVPSSNIHTEGKDIQTVVDEEGEENLDEENNSLPELDPPRLSQHSQDQARPKKKGVLQSLGKGPAIVCGKCSFQTEFRVVKAIHERIHQYSQDKTKCLWCPHCPFSTDFILHLKIHVQSHSEKTRIRVYLCSHCSYSSNQVDLVEDHHEDVHEKLELKSEVTRLVLEDLQCSECPIIVKNEEELLEHLEKQHGYHYVQKYLKVMYSIASLQIVDDENEEDDDEAQLNASMRSRVPSHSDETEDELQLGSDRFQCPNCNYSSYKCGTWVRHMQRHNTSGNQEIVLYCCKTCKWKSTAKQKTIDHCKSKHNEIILEVQTMEFSTLNVADGSDEAMDDVLVPPDDDSGGITKYHCDFCDFSTNERAILVKHWTSHEGQTASAMTCEDGDGEAEYLAPNAIEQKRRTEPDGVDMSFDDYNEETLRLLDDAFLRLQDDEGKPCKESIQCPICPYSSELRKCIRRHLVFHKTQAQIKNGFKCSYCPYMSEREGVVTRHMSVYHPDLPAKKIIIGHPKMKDEEHFSRDRMRTSSPATALSPPSHSQSPVDSEHKVFKTPRQCPKCDYTTKLQYNLLHHMKWHSKNAMETRGDTGPRVATASIPGSEANPEVVPEVSRRRTRRQTASEVTSGESPASDDEYCRSLFCTAVTGKDLFKCKSCVFMARDPAKIYLHFCTRHRNQCPFQCGYCEFRSIAVIKIQQHCHVTHNNLPIRISPVVDEKAADNATTMDLGYRTVTADLIEDESTLDDEQREQAYDDWLCSFMIKCGNNVQMCNICGYEQKGQAALKRHVLAVHLRYYPYKCKHCAFSAVEANKILKHTDKNHPNMERRIIRRKIPDDLPSVIDCEKEALSAAAAKGSREPAPVVPSPPKELEPNTSVLSVKIKEEPCSDPESEDVYGGATDDNLSDDDTTHDGSEAAYSVRIKSEPKDSEEDAEETQGKPSSTNTPVKLSRRHKYPKQYTKTYRCTECNYMSKWNLADVKHHVLTVHLKIHPYSCRYCCFGSPRRGRLMEHYDAQHPGLPTSADEAREEIQSALSIVEDGDDVFIGLSEKSTDIESKYLPNVKPRAPKAPGANLGGRQRGSSSSRHSSPAPGPTSPSLASSPSLKSPSRAALLSLGGTPDQPLDLSVHVTPPPTKGGLVPGRFTRGLNTPTTLRVPTIPKPYPPDSPSEQYPTSSSVNLVRMRKRSRKKEYTLHKCSSCGRGYVQKIKAQYHFALKHLNLHPYICNYCSFGEDARKRVIDHIIAEHPGQELVVFPAFREHALVQEKVYPVQVDLSEYEGAMRAIKYINESGLLQHREKSERCTVRCPQCSLMLPGMKDLDEHMESLHKDYTGFKCSYCGVYVKAKQKMKYHLAAKHPRFDPLYQPIKEGIPYGNPLSTFDEIVRKKPQFFGQRKPIMSNTNALTVAFPFYRPKQEKIGFANISKKRLSARCSRGYRENTGNLVEDRNLQMRVPTQPTPEETTVDGRPPPKMIKPRSDVVGGTVWLLCNHCTYTTLTSTLMRHHVMSHINYRPFRCSYCSFNGVRSHQVKKHMISMHRKLPPIVRYRTDPNVETSLTDHFTMKVRRGTMDGSIRPFWNKNLPSHSSVKSKWNARKSHEDGPILLKRLKIEQVEPAPVPEPKEHVALVESKKPVAEPEARRAEVYICVLCGFRRPSRSSLLRHIMWELDYRPWSCPHCEYKDVTLVGVKRHCFQSHAKQPFKMVLKQDPERMSKILAMVEQSKHSAGAEKATESPTAAGTVVKQEPIDPADNSSNVSAPLKGYSYNLANRSESVYEAGMLMAVPSDTTVVTSAEQLEAQEEQHYSGEAHIYRCKHCTFQSPDKTCFKKHILRHGPKRFQCGYCSYCAVFKAELHKHMNRLHKRKPYKIITLADNQVVTTKVKTISNRLKPVPMFPQAAITITSVAPTAPTISSFSVDPVAEGGMLAQLEAELKGMGSDSGPDSSASESKTPTKRKIKEDGEPQEMLAFAVLDGVVLTEEHLAMNAAGVYKCGFCDLTSTHRERARTHLAKHFQLRWKCAHCDLRHQLSYEMRRHIRSKHPGYPIKMARLETNGDFVSKTTKAAQTSPKKSPPASSTKTEVSVTPMTPYSKPGPACSKKHRPNPEASTSSIPSVFCCFLCTFKTNSTVELIEHQKMHAGEPQEDRMPTLTPALELSMESTESASFKDIDDLVGGDGDDPEKAAAEKRAPPVCYATDQSDKLESPARQNFVRPFKCGYCDFSGFARGKVKNHCIRIHKDKTILVVDQQQKEGSYKKSLSEQAQMPLLTSASSSDMVEEGFPDTDQPRFGPTALAVVADDVLSIPQLELKVLLKQNNLTGIRW